MKRVEPLVLVACGGFIGAVLRYGVALALPEVAGTLVANVVGSFVLGFLVSVTTTERIRLFLGTGLLSSFTTYSTFAVETTQLGPLAGTLNVGVTYLLGFVAAGAGLVVGGRR
ncbi:CrcB protein [Halogranum rubrum]|uniref:Fluoride-specific ion channel FluC n=2 Tax=Halogranum rubrum TaxID=553466 RepID=A0A1I4FYY0_9EURY|nr:MULTISPECIES: CrcB family protein [Halogranum]EJN59444.1 camphor resistance protein crcb [Halogranum salarium B-1]SFL22663.1 CrcB protein [Halogranum rubrum]